MRMRGIGKERKYKYIYLYYKLRYKASMKLKKNDAEVKKLQARYERLKKRLARLGPVLLGTITERTISRPNPEHPGGVKIFGPYYQWTFKEAGKTVTVNLGAAQVDDFRKAIERHRVLEETTEEMRALSRNILDATTEGVKRRKLLDPK